MQYRQNYFLINLEKKKFKKHFITFVVPFYSKKIFGNCQTKHLERNPILADFVPARFFLTTEEMSTKVASIAVVNMPISAPTSFVDCRRVWQVFTGLRLFFFLQGRPQLSTTSYAPKKDIQFAAESVESTQPVLKKRRKYTYRDIGLYSQLNCSRARSWFESRSCRFTDCRLILGMCHPSSFHPQPTPTAVPQKSLCDRLLFPGSI